MSNARAAAIIDLDNCVADDHWRLPLIDLTQLQPNDRYWYYHDKCDQDKHGNKHVISQLRYNYRLLVFTSRPEKVRDKTEAWLDAWDIPYDLLFMRPDDNHMASVDMKRLMLSWVPEGQYNIEHAIDDRHDILDMYRSQGIRQTRRVFIYEPELTYP